MTRVSENSNTHAVNFAISKAKSRLENLQLKGSNLKAITRPSDNPIANVESLSIESVQGDNKQFIRNSDFATLQLNTTEKSLEELTELLMKAKEIAIAQSSDFYDGEIRKNVSKEISQIYNQALTIANKRVGNRYIFSGHSTLKTPFNLYGDYSGDTGHIHLEVAKDFFIPINLHGKEVFFGENLHKGIKENPVQDLLEQKSTPSEEVEIKLDRSIASVQQNKNVTHESKQGSIFGVLSTFVTALETNDNTLIQSILEQIDESINRVITLRTRVGSLVSSVRTTQDALGVENVYNAEQKSKLVDADIAEVFSDITKQENVLKTTYQSGKAMLNQTLLDFLR